MKKKIEGTATQTNFIRIIISFKADILNIKQAGKVVRVILNEATKRTQYETLSSIVQ